MHHDGRGSPFRLAKRIPPSTPEGRWRCPGTGLWTRFESKSYIPRPVIGTFMSGLSAKLEEPVDETADALADRCVGPQTDGAFEVGGVRAGLRDVAWLHRKQLPDRWFSEGLLDEPHDLGHLDRFAIADVVDPPRCRTGCRVILGPGRIRRRRAPHEPHDRFNRVIDIGEVPAHVTAVEELDRSTLEDRFGEQPHGHVRTAPRAVDREKSQTRRREGKQM